MQVKNIEPTIASHALQVSSCGRRPSGPLAGQVTRGSMSLRVVWAAGLLALAAAGMSMAQTGLPPAQQANGIEYITGGFGDEMSAAFKQAQASYPLALTFAEDAGGGSRPYIAEVRVLIKDEAGQVVMDVPSAGPYFLARLEPGSYVVEATYMENTQTHEVSISSGSPTQKVLTWKTS